MISAFSDISIGNISSLVDKYIEKSVPSDIILVIYRFVPITEKPHCGMMPRRAPITGPSLFDFVIIFLFLFVNLCYKTSINRKATNKNGINFNTSIIVSTIISIIMIPPHKDYIILFMIEQVKIHTIFFALS